MHSNTECLQCITQAAAAIVVVHKQWYIVGKNKNHGENSCEAAIGGPPATTGEGSAAVLPTNQQQCRHLVGNKPTAPMAATAVAASVPQSSQAF